ncbi:MAG: LysR family transcriptional regulator [Pseudomonadota bacterium]
MRHLTIHRFIEAIHRTGSVRRAADDLNLTASALTRRIKLFEAELGHDIFERLPRGMHLNAAGELMLAHLRAQASELRQVRTDIEDLAGLRTGQVDVVCSQALLPYFLPRQVARFRARHPGVRFGVNLRDRAAAETDLRTFKADLALIVEPLYTAEIEILATIRQPLHAIVVEGHPLASYDDLRLRDCLDFPHVLPRERYGVRSLIEEAMLNIDRTLAPIVEADTFEFMRHYPRHEHVVGFQLPIGLSTSIDPGMVFKPISERDVRPGRIVLAQLQRRVLSTAGSAFALQLIEALQDPDTQGSGS